jgi:hypothetical protein
MDRRIIDVFLHDKLIASYPIVIDDKRPVLSSSDFVEELKQQMRERNPDFDVSAARFVVRGTPE